MQKSVVICEDIGDGIIPVAVASSIKEAKEWIKQQKSIYYGLDNKGKEEWFEKYKIDLGRLIEPFEVPHV